MSRTPRSLWCPKQETWRRLLELWDENHFPFFHILLSHLINKTNYQQIHSLRKNNSALFDASSTNSIPGLFVFFDLNKVASLWIFSCLTTQTVRYINHSTPMSLIHKVSDDRLKEIFCLFDQFSFSSTRGQPSASVSLSPPSGLWTTQLKQINHLNTSDS